MVKWLVEFIGSRLGIDEEWIKIERGYNSDMLKFG